MSVIIFPRGLWLPGVGVASVVEATEPFTTLRASFARHDWPEGPVKLVLLDDGQEVAHAITDGGVIMFGGEPLPANELALRHNTESGQPGFLAGSLLSAAIICSEPIDTEIILTLEG